MMKRAIPVISVLCLVVFTTIVSAKITRYEAEDGVLIGSTVSTDSPGYSGSGYVTDFDNTGDKVTITVNVDAFGSYPLWIGYRIPSGWGNKVNDILVNDVLIDSPTFINTNSMWSVHNFGDIVLNAGDNTITFEKNWGWMDVDYFETPEPGTVLLVGLGGLLLRRKRGF